MSANYFLKSIAFENYRGLGDLTIPVFRRINLISGYNGTGKSTLLEAIFFLLDRRGPISLTRPYVWRKLGMAGKGSLDQYFSGLDHTKKIKLTATTSGGNVDIAMEYGSTPSGVVVHIPNNRPLPHPDSHQSLGADLGLNIDVHVDGKPDDALFALPMPDGIAVNLYRAGKSKIPLGVIITPATRNAGQDDATRFSSIVKSNRLPELLRSLAVIRPNLKGIQLLQEGSNSTLYAELEDGTLHPFPMLGDGMQTILSIALAIMNSTGGIVLLDEFDSAIHYSALADVWAKIASLANTYSCQIFAVTHSRECIQAAVDGIPKGSRIEDLQYVRLERIGSKLSAVTYDGKELTNSLDAEWEVR